MVLCQVYVLPVVTELEQFMMAFLTKGRLLDSKLK